MHKTKEIPRERLGFLRDIYASIISKEIPKEGEREKEGNIWDFCARISKRGRGIGIGRCFGTISP